jgi:hypothetical protein
MTDHAAAVEAIRKRHDAFSPDSYAGETYWRNRARDLHADRATLLRAYEAVVAESESRLDTLTNLYKENATLRAQHAALVEGLQSIAANTCCDRCQEAALVATQLLATLGGAEGV